MNVPAISSILTSAPPKRTCTCGGSNGSSRVCTTNWSSPSYMTVGTVLTIPL